MSSINNLLVRSNSSYVTWGALLKDVSLAKVIFVSHILPAFSQNLAVIQHKCTCHANRATVDTFSVNSRIMFVHCGRQWFEHCYVCRFSPSACISFQCSHTMTTSLNAMLVFLLNFISLSFKRIRDCLMLSLS